MSPRPFRLATQRSTLVQAAFWFGAACLEATVCVLTMLAGIWLLALLFGLAAMVFAAASGHYLDLAFPRAEVPDHAAVALMLVSGGLAFLYTVMLVLSASPALSATCGVLAIIATCTLGYTAIRTARL